MLILTLESLNIFYLEHAIVYVWYFIIIRVNWRPHRCKLANHVQQTCKAMNGDVPFFSKKFPIGPAYLFRHCKASSHLHIYVCTMTGKNAKLDDNYL